MKNIFKLFRSSNKENDLNRTSAINQSKRGRQPLRSQNVYEDDDEPMNPYHAPSQPRRQRGPRSVAGGERLDDRYDRQANRSFESEYHYRDRPSKSRHDYERQSQKRSSKHHRNQKTSEYGSGEASPARYHHLMESESEAEEFAAFRDSKRVEQRIHQLHNEMKELKIENRRLTQDNHSANLKVLSQRDEIRELKARLKEARKELAIMKQMPPHFAHTQPHQPHQFARHSAAFDIPPPMPMNQSLFHPNMNSSMHGTIYRNGPPFGAPTQNYSPRAPSTSAAGAGESLANQSSHFVTTINTHQVNVDADDHDELKVYREPEESSEFNSVSCDESLAHAAEDMRSGTPEPIQFTPQISSSSLTLVEEEGLSENYIARAAMPQKRMDIKRSMSFNN